MAVARHTTARGRGKPNKAFLAALMSPLPEAELADPELGKLEKKAVREARSRADIKAHANWERGMFLVMVAHGNLLMTRGAYALNKTAENEIEAEKAEIIYRKVRLGQIIERPAPGRAQLRWKKNQHDLANEPTVIAAIARDEVRLGIVKGTA